MKGNMKTLAVIIAFYVLAWCPVSAASLEETVDELVPKLAAEKVEARYASQMELQALALKAARPGSESERSQLAKLLASKAADQNTPQPARVWIVRQLEYVGAAESVGALTKLLSDSDSELKECARRALEKNAAPAASESLRAALKQATEPTWQIGLINSLGERHDTTAVDLIKPYLQDKIAATTAALALAKIGNDAALEALWSAYDKRTASVDDALIAAGNHMLAMGRKPQAGALFERLYFAGTTNAVTRDKKDPAASIQVRCAALVGIAAANPSRASRLLKDALNDKDARLQSVAVTAAVTAYGNSATSALAPLLAKAPSTAKAYIMRVLDTSAESRVIPLANDADETVSVAALETLGRIGSEASVPVLLKAATGTSSASQKAASAALAKISGPGADAALQKTATEGDTKTRVVAIHALADRNDKTAVPMLIKVAPQSDPAISAAAYAALARLADEQEIETLVRLALTGKSSGADEALQAVASRARDKSKTAAIVARLIASEKAEPAGLIAVFKVLPTLGGDSALNVASTAASSTDAQLKDAAIRALASWPDFAATKVLLKIATANDTSQVENVVAIQGIVRLVKASEHEPVAARLEVAQEAWKAARRSEEKKLIISALASIPSAASAEFLKPLLTQGDFKNEACLAAVALAESLVKSDKPAAKALAQAVKDANPSADAAKKADALLKR
jgi:HEAT repeat protein